MSRKIYLASSWRNPHHSEVLQLLRSAGHEVFDFTEPGANFYWGNVDPDWQNWTAEEAWVKLKYNADAVKGFERDAKAIENCDTLILLMPCGRSAHIEMGVAVGLGKDVVVLYPASAKFEVELMYSYANLMTSDTQGLLEYLEKP